MIFVKLKYIVKIVKIIRKFSYLFKTTKVCRLNSGCCMHPKDCVDERCLYIYKWTEKKDSTDFEITGFVELIDSVLLAIGKRNV